MGTLSQRDLAQKLLKSTGNISVVLKNFEKRGQISRERNLDDTRYMEVCISKTGQGLLVSFFKKHVQGIVEEMAVLSPQIIKGGNTRESQFTRPLLTTTVHIPKYEIGMLAIQKLNGIIMGKNPTAFKSVVYSELIARFDREHGSGLNAWLDMGVSHV